MATVRFDFTLEEAVLRAPSLANLVLLAQTSQRYLACIKPLLPPALLPAIAAGPIEDTVWCLVVQGNAVAAKLRQMLPRLVTHLQAQEHRVSAIRLRVLPAQTK
jgi:hypothetical protein